MNLSKVSVLLLFAALSVGCGTMSNLPAGANFIESSSQSVVVMGVTPAFRIQVFPGVMNADGWGLNMTDNAVLNTTPEGGYIVAPIRPSRPGQSYGVNRILPPGGGILSVCTGGTTAVFDVPPGAVIYVGDVSLLSGGNYRIRVSYDFEKAVRFMREKYPSMAPRLTEGKMRAAKVRHSECGSGGVVVVVVI